MIQQKKKKKSWSLLIRLRFDKNWCNLRERESEKVWSSSNVRLGVIGAEKWDTAKKERNISKWPQYRWQSGGSHPAATAAAAAAPIELSISRLTRCRPVVGYLFIYPFSLFSSSCSVLLCTECTVWRQHPHPQWTTTFLAVLLLDRKNNNNNNGNNGDTITVVCAPNEDTQHTQQENR